MSLFFYLFFSDIILEWRRRLPDVIIIGCKKCGTSALRNLLGFHSQIAAKRNEANFFDKDEHYKLGLKHYQQMQMMSFSDQLTLEKTPRYWIHNSTPERIYKMNPQIKLILIVRDPIKRIISDFCHAKRYCVKHNISENPYYKGLMRRMTFEQYIIKEKRKLNLKSNILLPSYYDIHIQRWLKVFPLSQIHIIKNEDLLKNRSQVLFSLEDYLGIHHELSDMFEVGRHKEMCVFDYKVFGGYHCNRLSIHKHPPTPNYIVYKLKQEFEPHMRRFYQLVGRDFGWF